MAVKFCGFAAVRCFLVLLNSIYIGIAIFLIGLVIAARTLAYNFTNIQILIGIGIVAGFLFVVAILGLIGTLRHNQIVMFFYMILLGLSGVALFAVSVAALAVPKQFQEDVFRNVWQSLTNKSKSDIQDQLNCCGFNDDYQVYLDCSIGHMMCNTTALLKGCCENPETNVTLTDGPEDCQIEQPRICPQCNACYGLWEDSVGKGLKLAGGLGLLFSFTQIAGIILTVRYRNLKDPTVNPVDLL